MRVAVFLHDPNPKQVSVLTNASLGSYARYNWNSGTTWPEAPTQEIKDLASCLQRALKGRIQRISIRTGPGILSSVAVTADITSGKLEQVIVSALGAVRGEELHGHLRVFVDGTNDLDAAYGWLMAR